MPAVRKVTFHTPQEEEREAIPISFKWEKITQTGPVGGLMIAVCGGLRFALLIEEESERIEAV